MYQDEGARRFVEGIQALARETAERMRAPELGGALGRCAALMANLPDPVLQLAYLSALANPRWAKLQPGELGRHLAELPLRLDRMFIEAGVPHDREKQEREWRVGPRAVQVAPLVLSLEPRPARGLLEEAVRLLDGLAEPVFEIDRTISDEVARQTHGRDDLVFEIYRDAQLLERHQRPRERDRDLADYLTMLPGLRDDLRNALALADDRRPLSDVLSQIRFLAPWLDDSGSLEDRARRTLGALDEPFAEDEACIVARREEAIESLRPTHREATLAHGRRMLAIEAERRPFSPNIIPTLLQEAQQLRGWRVGTGANDIERVLGSDLRTRELVVMRQERYTQDCAQSRATGVAELLAGGPINCPSASPVSVVQNHCGYPNLAYGPQILDRLRGLLESVTATLGAMPDLFDVAAPSRLRERRTLVYRVAELEKDPTDVTFGNDAGCCIFVPEDAANMLAGWSVPLYLAEPACRLFGVFREKGAGVQRMGLVLAMECLLGDARVLVCNSLELSRTGLAGGRVALKQLVAYVEDWLIVYAREHGYAGCTMGAHAYGTSVNYSSRAGDRVAETLVFEGRPYRFHSDVFQADEALEKLVTRPNGSYWLWRRDAAEVNLPALAPSSR